MRRESENRPTPPQKSSITEKPNARASENGTRSNSKKRKLDERGGKTATHDQKAPDAQKFSRPPQTTSHNDSPKSSAQASPPHTKRITAINSAPTRNGHANPRPAAGGRLAARRDELLPARQRLPIWPHAPRIRRALSGFRDVLVLAGETGSGKSTQVPQFLLGEPWCRAGCVAVTQPRRVAAVSLARRVAEEMGSTLGGASPASRVGYAVRFDVSVGPAVRVKFLTEGMLLQEMLRDPALGAYSAVVVDEVHERSVNVDLILGFLRNLLTRDRGLRKGKPLKVVVMSATADVEGLLDFFREGYGGAADKNGVLSADGDAVGSESSWSGISSSDEDLGARSDEKDKLSSKGSPKGPSSTQNGTLSDTNGHEALDLSDDRIALCSIEGRQYPVKTLYLPEPTQDFVEAALKSVFQIHYKEPLPGDILVFLTGQDTVEALERLVNEYAEGMEKEVPKILTVPLFAALPQVAQQKVFDPAPPKTRKVIIATNIAETSVTVPGVCFVVDCGKVKIKQFRNRLGLDSLLVKSISQSAAIQRQGRAGREAPGQCFRLYTEADYRKLQAATTPEILRCDLSAALLAMKARGIDDVMAFPLLDRPPREALEKALLQLYQLGALTDEGAISEMGAKMAKMPLAPTLGRIILEAARPERACLLEVIDIIACLSVENIFLNVLSEEKKEEAEAARAALFRREGDHLTLLVTARQYAAERADRRAWAERHFVSHRAMQNVMDIRKQLRAQCAQMKLLPASELSAEDGGAPSEELANAVLRCLLRGFAANTARMTPDGGYKTVLGNQAVAIHPASVLFGRKIEAIVFSEFVFTNRSYARGVSAVRLEWVGEVLAGSS